MRAVLGAVALLLLMPCAARYSAVDGISRARSVADGFSGTVNDIQSSRESQQLTTLRYHPSVTYTLEQLGNPGTWQACAYGYVRTDTVYVTLVLPPIDAWHCPAAQLTTGAERVPAFAMILPVAEDATCDITQAEMDRAGMFLLVIRWCTGSMFEVPDFAARFNPRAFEPPTIGKADVRVTARKLNDTLGGA